MAVLVTGRSVLCDGCFIPRFYVRFHPFQLISYVNSHFWVVRVWCGYIGSWDCQFMNVIGDDEICFASTGTVVSWRNQGQYLGIRPMRWWAAFNGAFQSSVAKVGLLEWNEHVLYLQLDIRIPNKAIVGPLRRDGEIQWPVEPFAVKGICTLESPGYEIFQVL